jgi:hypothetical protein
MDRHQAKRDSFLMQDPGSDAQSAGATKWDHGTERHLGPGELVGQAQRDLREHKPERQHEAQA